ncbi:MAG: methylated-DNA--[protein]-cysteine S-methyltransferase [Ktedonobacterales bacterium]|nr:methylated-DNA--[protein]-cysteine S-methyltransferase [Ktedonobacterales bacterium]
MAIASAAESLATGDVTTWAGRIRVAASRAGIRQVWLPDWHVSPAHTETQTPRVPIARGDGGAAERHVRQALDELAAYFAGERRAFTVALDLQGPAFFRRAWDEVARVPYGETRSYGEMARALGAPAATRAVGAANGANPVAPLVPCHRIIGSDGRLTGYGPGLALKQRLLEMEDAVPATRSAYAAWAARVRARLGMGLDEPLLLGVRATGVCCRADCDSSQRSLRPPRFFRTAEAAHAAGFRPCGRCQPAARMDAS